VTSWAGTSPESAGVIVPVKEKRSAVISKKLEGQVAVVTGASKGIGAAIAKRDDIAAEIFPRSAQQWNGLTDVTDARILAKHMEWVATSEAGRHQAFNIVNGEIFRWR
jgi:hypothetical protein